ncbi:MAG: pentapeptide repeat-containing protein [Phormidesmis sp.]
MQPTQLLQRYQDGKRDFSWVDLQGADLSGAVLVNINLYRANLTGANLTGTDLSNASLFKATLTQANLSGATLTGTNLAKADLTGASIDENSLDNAKLRGATLPDGSLYVAPQPEIEADVDGEEDLSATSSETGPNEEQWADENTNLEQVHLGVHSQQTSQFPSQLSSQLSSQPTPANAPVPSVSEAQLSTGALVGLTCGYLCYGLVLGGHQASVLSLPLVWSTAFVGRAKFASVWTVPVTAAAAVILCSGVSVGVLIFGALPIIMIFVGFNFYGNILNQRFFKTLQDIIFFSSLVFVLMALAPWMFDGSRAYSGGGIVVNLDSFVLGLFLILGMICTAIGSLFLLRDVEERLVQASAYASIGGESMIGRFEDMPVQEDEYLTAAASKQVIPRVLLLQKFGITAAIGLVLGRLLGLL